ncbi:MAG TPA: hypothetical protein VMF89_01115, partial [Polyangiales bacterium]|nr:hypothetical protein [Polyangiales bacterium]
DYDAGSPAGYCLYQGKQLPVGTGFARADNCNKCTCVADGLIECSNISCTPPPGCLIGSQLVQIGARVICEDGCNTCTCQMDGKFSRTERACPALPAVSKCTGAASALQIPAGLAYQSGDALFVSDSRCVNGQANDFSLCYDDLVSTMGNEVTVYMVAGSGTRACSLSERVFSLVPLREDYLATFSGRTGGKVVLRGTGNDFVYQFGM